MNNHVSHVAVVGAGPWGKNLVRNFAELGALRVVCDIDSSRLNSFAGQYPDVKLMPSFAEVVKSEVRAVVIATPASSHYVLAREALFAGKDVFVEKPLSLKVSEGRELVELAENEGRVLMVGHLLHYHPAVVNLKTLIDKGQLGKLYYIYSNRLNLGRFRTEENILWSFAPHDISAILYLLGEMPTSVAAQGGSYLNQGIPDVTVTALEFRSGVRGHIFVSWLHPYKEQKLVVVGDRRMAVFDDVQPEHKLLLLNHKLEWVERLPVPRMEEAEPVPLPKEEPLRAECRHFLDCIASRRRPNTDGQEGVRVLEILEACQESLDRRAAVVSLPKALPTPYFAHETAVIDEPCDIGEGTRIWHFSHVMTRSRIGRSCSIGQNVFIGSHVTIGDGVKIQNNVSVYEGVTLEDYVFCGPSVVFTNVFNPRSEIRRMDELRPTLVRKGATLGANCTIVCGVTIGQCAFVGAGGVVLGNVPDFALVVGNPGKTVGWMCMCGNRIDFEGENGPGICRMCKQGYLKTDEKVSVV